MNFPQYTDYRPGQQTHLADDSPSHLTAYQQPSSSLQRPADDRVLGGLAQATAFPFGLFGPLVFWALSREDSGVRREAAKAFNFTTIMTILAAATMIFDLPALFFVVGTVWFVLSIIGTVHAFRGDDWDNPVSRVVPWVPLGAGKARNQKCVADFRRHRV